MKRFNPQWLNKPRKRSGLEGRIQLQIIHYLKMKGAAVGKTKTMGVRDGGHYRFDIYTFRGFPDLTCFINNTLYFIEVKSPRGIQSPEQQTFELLCHQAGIHYILAKSLEDVISVIK